MKSENHVVCFEEVFSGFLIVSCHRIPLLLRVERGGGGEQNAEAWDTPASGLK